MILRAEGVLKSGLAGRADTEAATAEDARAEAAGRSVELAPDGLFRTI